MKSSRDGKRLPVEQTVRYKVVFKALCEFARQKGGNSPTERGLAHILRGRMKYSTVRGHLLRLEEDGLIKKVDGEIVIIGAQWKPPDR